MYDKKEPFSGQMDRVLIGLYLALSLIGILCIFSVEYRGEQDVLSSFVAFKKNYSKQFIYFSVCLVLGMFILLTDSKLFTATPNLLYAFGIILLIATFFVGKAVKGSQSWIPLGFMNLQPVETCKIFASLALAKYLSRPETDFDKPRSQLIATAIVFVPALFSILQNETGLALVYFAFLLPMYREGFPAVYLIIGVSLALLLVITLLFEPQTLIIAFTAIALLVLYSLRRKMKRNRSIFSVVLIAWAVSSFFVALAVPFLFKNVFQKHQTDRIYSLIGRDNPYHQKSDNIQAESKPKPKKKKGDTENYNVKQSKIAIGSGGFWGKGFLKGTQTRGEFVPEQHTDFIFTSLGENFGFVGSALLMMLYLWLLLRLIQVAERQRSKFSRVYAYSVAAILFFHVSVNICMTIGLAPVIGITLPLMSYGGSSLLTFTVLIFILIRLDMDRQMVLR
jgi:rod shape determining protein RodA